MHRSGAEAHPRMPQPPGQPPRGKVFVQRMQCPEAGFVRLPPPEGEMRRTPVCIQRDIYLLRGFHFNDPYQHGWQGRLARQSLRRAGLEKRQIRGGLPEGLCQRAGSPCLHRKVSGLLQRPEATSSLGRQRRIGPTSTRCSQSRVRHNRGKKPLIKLPGLFKQTEPPPDSILKIMTEHQIRQPQRFNRLFRALKYCELRD
jgi:hypothetical protein